MFVSEIKGLILSWRPYQCISNLTGGLKKIANVNMDYQKVWISCKVKLENPKFKVKFSHKLIKSITKSPWKIQSPRSSGSYLLPSRPMMTQNSTLIDFQITLLFVLWSCQTRLLLVLHHEALHGTQIQIMKAEKFISHNVLNKVCTGMTTNLIKFYWLVMNKISVIAPQYFSWN